MLAFMYFNILYITLPQTFGQFKEHIDLQKVSEIIFKNEKYNVLKPTIHIVRDHFKDFIQKRNNYNFPTERVFLDKNGFRHFWKDMEIKPNSLRKADLSKKAIANIDKKDAVTLQSDKEHLGIATNISNNTIVKVKDKPRRKKRIEADVFTPVKPNLRGDSVIMKTTFFCPFFGVITMSTSVDDFNEQDVARL